MALQCFKGGYLYLDETSETFSEKTQCLHWVSFAEAVIPRKLLACYQGDSTVASFTAVYYLYHPFEKNSQASDNWVTPQLNDLLLPRGRLRNMNQCY